MTQFAGDSTDALKLPEYTKQFTLRVTKRDLPETIEATLRRCYLYGDVC